MSDAAAIYPTQTVVKCDVCSGTDDVKWFCRNCPGSLCDACKVSHANTDISRKHFIVQRSETVVRTYGPAKIAEECAHHKGKDITIYCKACNVPCCVTCHVENHQLHKFCPIEEVYLRAEKRLNTYIKGLEDDVLTRLDTIANQIETDNLPYQTDIDHTKTEVNNFRERIKSTVDKKCDSLIDTLQKFNFDKTSLLYDIEEQKQLNCHGYDSGV